MASIKDSIEYVFKQVCIAAGDTSVDASELRFEFTPSSREEATYFKTLNGIKTTELSFNLRAAKFSDETHSYVAFTIAPNIAQEFELPHQISTISLQLPHFLYLASYMGLGVKSEYTKDMLENNLLWQHKDSAYQGHSYHDVVECFENLIIIKFDKNNIIDDYGIERLFYYLLSFNKKFNHVEYFGINKLYQRAFSELEKISYNNIFLSMTSYHRKHSFLEIYRCLEWIYVLPRTLKLKEDINYQDIGFKLANSCTSKLSWRRKEEDSLSLLVQKAFEISSEFKHKAYWMDVFYGVPLEKIAARAYLLRNQFVHQFTQEKEIDISEEQYDELICFTLELLLILYKEYELELV